MHQQATPIRRESARKKAARLNAIDREMNQAKREQLHAFSIPQYTLIISPIEAQALSEGVVSTAILRQLQTLLKPEPLQGEDFTPTAYRGERLF
jgi:hypothetical protein